MTQFGLDYLKHLESQRHNIRTEDISQQEADTRYSQHLETSRHNRRQESLDSQTLSETKRANRAKEFETNRANVANEAIKLKQIEKEDAAKRYAADTAATATKSAANMKAQATRYAADKAQQTAVAKESGLGLYALSDGREPGKGSFWQRAEDVVGDFLINAWDAVENFFS